MTYGSLSLRIDDILTEKGISKNQICKDLDIPNPILTSIAEMNFNDWMQV